MPKPLWISVEEGIADSAKVWRFATALLTPPEAPRSPTKMEVAAAIGFLVQLWLKVADRRETGDVSDVPPGLLASWAGWDGDATHFASCFTSAFVSDGIIHDWETHQGKLIEYRAKERARWQHRRARGNTIGDSASAPPETPTELRPPDGHGDGLTPTAATAGALVIGGPKHLAIADRMTQDRYRSALEGYLRAAHDPPRLLEQFTLTVDGLAGPGGRPVSPDQLGAALNAMAIAGTKCTEKILAAFVLREVEPEKANGNGKHRTDAKTQGTLDAMERFKRKHGVPTHA